MAVQTDNFNRADNADLGAAWDPGAVGSSFKIVSNHAEPSDVGGDMGELFNTFTPASADYYVQAKLTVNSTGGGGAGIGVQLRGSIASQNCYRIVMDHAASNNVQCSRFNSGASTLIGNKTLSFSDGDTIAVSISGTGATVTLELWKAGVSQGTWADSDANRLTASGVGGVAYSSTVASASLDDFEIGDGTPGGGAAAASIAFDHLFKNMRQGG